MIVMLDDIGRALYKRLKAEADALVKIRSTIKYKKKLVVLFTEQWLDLEDNELDEEADRVYFQKHKVELEIQQLEYEEKASLQRISQYVNPQTRSA